MAKDKLETFKDYIILHNVFEIACVYATGSTDTISRRIVEVNPYYIAFEKEKHYKILYIDNIYKPEIKETIVTEKELKEQCDKVFKLMKTINSNRKEVMMDDKEYQSDEYITDVIVTFIEATMNKEHDYETYKQAKKDLTELIRKVKGDKQ